MEEQFKRDVEQLGDMLQKTYSSGGESDRKQIESQLSTLSSQNPKFIEYLAAILIQPQFDDNLKVSSATYINTYTKEILSNSDLVTDDKLYNVRIIGELLKSNINLKLKKIINKALIQFLYTDYNQQLAKTLYQHITPLLSGDSRAEIQAGSLLVQAMLTTLSNTQELQNFYNSFKRLLNETGAKLVLLILQNIQQQQETELQSNLELVQGWSETIQQLVEKLNSSRMSLLKEVARDEILPQIILQLIGLDLKNQQTTNSIISYNNQTQLDSNINTIKQTVFKSLNIIMPFIFDSKPDQQLNQTQFFISTNNLINIVFDSLLSFSRQQKNRLLSVLERKDLESLVVEMLIFLTKCGTQTEFYNIFWNYKKDLLMEVILPMLKTSQSEKELFINSPEEFVSLALDTCDKQLSETFKTQAAQLMEILCDHIDGTISFLGNLCCQAIDYSMRESGSYPLLEELKESEFVKGSAQDRLDTSILLLCVISYLVPKRDDLVALLEKTVENNMSSILSVQMSGIVKTRICLLFAYYNDNLFKEQEKQGNYQLMLEYLVQSILVKKEDEHAIALQAIDSVSNIFEDEDNVKMIKPFVGQLFEILLNVVQQIDCAQFFDLIQNIIKFYTKEISETQYLIVACVRALTARIQQELIKLEPGKKTNIIINKCWNIIRTIGEKNEFVVNNLLQIEQELAPLYNCLEFPEKIDFEEDIILLQTSLLKRTKTLTESMLKLFLTYTKIFENQKCSFGNLFQTLNYYIYYGSQILGVDPKNIEILMIMGTEGMFARERNANEANHQEGALLLQLLIQYFYSYLNKTQLQKIFMKCFERLQQNVKNDFLKAQIMGVFLSGFAYCFIMTQEVLQDMNQLDQIIKMIIENQNVFNNQVYHQKILSIGLSNIMVQQDISPLFKHKITEIFDIIISALRNQQLNEQKEENKKSKRKNSEKDNKDDEFEDDDSDIFEDEDDEDEDDDLDFEKENEQYEMKVSLDLLISEVKKLDEFQHFKSIIQRLKELNQQGLVELVQSLEPQKQQYLREVLSSQRISLEGEKTIARKIVKVRGKKKIN